MRYALIGLWMLLASAGSANAQLSIGIGFPGVNIGINLPLYPELVPVPGYPVYYAPRLGSNFFFYDGMYWVYQRDNWYASDWYNGPWWLMDRYEVPLFVLRIPVRYYRDPPAYFSGWRRDAPPRWGDQWGDDWAQRRSGWDNWNRRAAPAAAPLPVYQRQYSGDRYPREEQQNELRNRNYRYQPRDAVVQQHYKAQSVQQAAPAPVQREQRNEPQDSRSRPQENQHANPQAQPRQEAPAVQRGQTREEAPAVQRGQTRQEAPVQGVVQKQPQAPRAVQENPPQDKGAAQDSRRSKGQEKDREKGDAKRTAMSNEFVMQLLSGGGSPQQDQAQGQ